jgi:hypothetical protein
VKERAPGYNLGRLLSRNGRQLHAYTEAEADENCKFVITQFKSMSLSTNSHELKVFVGYNPLVSLRHVLV